MTRTAATCIGRATPAEAREIILDICRGAGAKTVTKGKSMVGEEIGINDHLAANGIEPVETDLGEYIIQLRHEPPEPHHRAGDPPDQGAGRGDLPRGPHRPRPQAQPQRAVERCCTRRAVKLRGRFLAADVGITGANFLVAETGTSIIVTNEGNGDLTQTLPRIHIVLASIEKVVPTLEDAGDAAAPAGALGDRAGDVGLHDVLDRAAAAGRSRRARAVSRRAARQRPQPLLGGEFQDMLRCIRCGACLNHCPIYHAVGGHAYGWVYPGPMGAVLTPA